MYFYINSTYVLCFVFYQLVLLLLAFVSVPWMLLPKPFILKKQHDAVCSLFLVLKFPTRLHGTIVSVVVLTCNIYATSEARGWIVYTTWKYRWELASGVKPRFPWSWGIWVQWSLCTSTYTYHRICAWSSL